MGDDAHANCLDACALDADDGRQFWSATPDAPFTYTTLFDRGTAAHYAIWAEGEPGL